ncbi:tRNA synthetases class I (W and Y) family protein, putative [Babesia bigemina]|uniref:tryptophan--tRNA ligase n=1 Tax=Babesia bigemina TaxID=5866 RepID=A0A061D9Y8_BABBI|nr:tRNA synthetases class I (W and Y) family protein, putative [Babesia bigemina]CDR97318.1 tRNA synthetases class I (W and Y) family protein, putative [Babesia bigemina]|eukprot:XP_012769504.1 tRNA synthetases class I (W and Y) family protein, putative [Babesia bigemina]
MSVRVSSGFTASRLFWLLHSTVWLWLSLGARGCSCVSTGRVNGRYAGFLAPQPRPGAVRSTPLMGAIAGIQPTGDLHIGNYIGCIHPAVQYQNDGGQLVFMVADLHATTGDEPVVDLGRQSLSTVATLLACGVDPERTSVILQSQFPEILELNWILGTAVSLGRLRKLANFAKRVVAQESDSVGQCLYPLLMAADVLCSDSDTIIAGDDQACHVGLIREVANKLNRRISQPVVKVPERYHNGGFRVLSLDGAEKMSKSNSKEASRIHLTDDDEAIFTKLRAAKTASDHDLAAPEIANLVRLMRFFSGGFVDETDGCGRPELQFSELKSRLHEAVSSHLRPIRTRYLELMQNDAMLKAVLQSGRRRQQPVFSAVVEVRRSGRRIHGAQRVKRASNYCHVN